MLREEHPDVFGADGDDDDADMSKLSLVGSERGHRCCHCGDWPGYNSTDEESDVDDDDDQMWTSFRLQFDSEGTSNDVRKLWSKKKNWM